MVALKKGNLTILEFAFMEDFSSEDNFAIGIVVISKRRISESRESLMLSFRVFFHE